MVNSNPQDHIIFLIGKERIRIAAGPPKPIIGWGTRLESIGEYEGRVYNGKLNIGPGVSLGTFCHIGAAYQVDIGCDVMFASGVTVLDHDHGTRDLSRPPRYQPLTGGYVSIGDNCWIGEHVFIGPHTVIGDNCVIGANTFLKNVTIPDNMIVYGQEKGQYRDRVREQEDNKAIGKTAIIIPTVGYSGIEKCLEAINEHTAQNRTPYEVLVMVDGSNAYRTITGRSGGNYPWARWNKTRLILAQPEQVGFAATVNHGLREALEDPAIEYVCILNDDTEVKPFWLERMINTLKTYPLTGIVGPMSNMIAGPQQIELSRPYALREYYGKTMRVPNVMGVCMVMRKALVQEIGFLDERFGLGNFEDNDYCRRTTTAGYDIRFVQDAFVYHEGSRSFKMLDINYDDLLLENLVKFKEKWEGEATLHDF